MGKWCWYDVVMVGKVCIIVVMVDAVPRVNPLALPNLPLCPTSAVKPSHTKLRCVGL